MEINISYSQISIFDDNLESPFNNWSDRHVAQGFSYREKSVSFMTLTESGKSEVSYDIVDRLRLFEDTSRAISVPFTVDENCTIVIASIEQQIRIQLPPNNYTVLYQTGLRDGVCWIHFSFSSQMSNEPEIPVADDILAPIYPLVMTADPA